MELHFHGSGLRVAQEKDHLHRTRIDRDRLRVRDFIVNNPLRLVGQIIHDKDVAASDVAVSDGAIYKRLVARECHGRPVSKKGLSHSPYIAHLWIYPGGQGRWRAGSAGRH
jgi:hypothetical protein